MSTLDSKNCVLIVDKNNQFERFYLELIDLMSKCMYRKVIEEIDINHSIFHKLENFWRVREVKIKCYLKIVNRKIFKYEFYTSKKRNIENWLDMIDREIDVFMKDIETSEQDREIQVDIYLELYLNLLYNTALFWKNEKELFECIGCLAIGDKLIKEKMNSDSKLINANINININQYTTLI